MVQYSIAKVLKLHGSRTLKEIFIMVYQYLFDINLKIATVEVLTFVPEYQRWV